MQMSDNRHIQFSLHLVSIVSSVVVVQKSSCQSHSVTDFLVILFEWPGGSNAIDYIIHIDNHQENEPVFKTKRKFAI